jgi:hypothetical protein
VSWFGEFYKRNVDALMVKSIFGHVIDDVNNVRDWMNTAQHGGVIEGPNSSTHGEEDGVSTTTYF